LATAQVANPEPESALRGRRVLVVEDEMLLAMEFDTVLRGQGCIVLGPVATVGRALTLIDEAPPEAAILDLNLRGHSSLPVAAALNGRNVPFLVVSGYSTASMPTPELGQAPRLSKPVDPFALLRELARLLEMFPRG
jgi:CheY-like chemotaxis protein